MFQIFPYLLQMLSDSGLVSSDESAASIAALRVKLQEFETRRVFQKMREEETLKRLFEEAGGSSADLGPGISLSEQAMSGLIVGTEGERNLSRFRQYL